MNCSFLIWEFFSEDLSFLGVEVFETIKASLSPEYSGWFLLSSSTNSLTLSENESSSWKLNSLDRFNDSTWVKFLESSKLEMPDLNELFNSTISNL